MDLVFMTRVHKNSLMEVTLSKMTLMRMTSIGKLFIIGEKGEIGTVLQTFLHVMEDLENRDLQKSLNI